MVFLFPLPQMANNPGTQQMYKKNLYMMDSMTDDELDGKVSKGVVHACVRPNNCGPPTPPSIKLFWDPPLFLRDSDQNQ